MKTAQKKKIGTKKTGDSKAENKKSGAKKIVKTPKAAARPLVRIAAKIRSKVLNINSVEAPKPVLPVPVKVKQKPGEAEFEVKRTRIRVIGIGGGGSNIVSEIAGKVRKSSFCIANTDFAALRGAPKNVSVFQFGENFTHGLGTGMDPRIAEEAANVDKEQIKKMMEGQDLVIIVASLGGGTGSGAAPVFAQISKSLGNLTYGIFTLPFDFEGAKKSEIAKSALEKLKPCMNALTILPNERVFEVVPKATPFSKTLSYVNTMLSGSLEGLIETIYDTGVINIDFADLRAILAGNGKMAFLNTVMFKKGEEANLDSFEKVFDSPLYPYSIDKARGLLLNIVAQKDLKLLEVNKILTSVAGRIHKDAKIIFGVGHEGARDNAVKVTVLATGCVYAGAGNGDDNGREVLPPPIPPETGALPATAAKKTVAGKKQKSGRGKKKPLGKSSPKPAAKSVKNKKSGKNGMKTAPSKKPDPKKGVMVKIKTLPPEKKIEKTSEKNAALAVLGDANSFEQDDYQSRQSIAAQFEAPVRKNALQVKKEVEMEEKEMLEKEKAWEVPAFLRKQKK